MKAFVTEANYQDGIVASWLLRFVIALCPMLALIWADKAYRGSFVDEAEKFDVEIEIVSADSDQQGFQVQPRRWVVERTFAWLSNYRRLSKDYEQWVQSSDAVVYAAMTHVMLRRLARLRASN